MVSGAFGRFWSLGFLAGFAAITSSVALGQWPSVSSPKQPIDTSQRVTLRGNIHPLAQARYDQRSEEHTSELQSQSNLVCRLLLEKKKKKDHRDSVRQLY